MKSDLKLYPFKQGISYFLMMLLWLLIYTEN